MNGIKTLRLKHQKLTILFPFQVRGMSERLGKGIH